jgi:hypothetical protein
MMLQGLPMSKQNKGGNMRTFKGLILRSLVAGSLLVFTVPSYAAGRAGGGSHGGFGNDIRSDRADVRGDLRDLREDWRDLSNDRRELHQDRRDEASPGEIASDRRTSEKIAVISRKIVVTSTRIGGT